MTAVQKGQVAGHAARALWNLTSKHAANQEAVREAGAVAPLVNLLDAPANGNVHLLPHASLFAVSCFVSMHASLPECRYLPACMAAPFTWGRSHATFCKSSEQCSAA